MIKCVYVVHSKLNEDLVRDEFETADEAIEYAEENKDQETSVEQVEVDVNDFGEVTDVGASEIIYEYYDEDDEDDEEPIGDEMTVDDYIDDAKIDAELDADYQALMKDDAEYAEADELDTLEDQAMAEAEHPVDEAMKVKNNKLWVGDEEMVSEERALKAAKPVTDEKTVKKSIKDRLSDMEIKLGVAKKDMDPTKEVDTVCKDTKVILHSEDDVKDLKENLDTKKFIKKFKMLSLKDKAKVFKIINPDTDYKPIIKDGQEYLEMTMNGPRAAQEAILDSKEMINGIEVDLEVNLKPSDNNYKHKLKELEKIMHLNLISLKESLDDYEIKNVHGHYAVYKGAEFILSADTEAEAEKELEKLLKTDEAIDYDKLREELEENEDEVECQVCFETFDKKDCIKKEHGYVCKHCASLEEEALPMHKKNIDRYYEMINDFVNFKVAPKALADYGVDSGDITPEELENMERLEMKLAKAIDDWASYDFDGEVNEALDTNTIAAPHVGDTIRIIKMEGEPNYTGRTGIIKSIDSLGQLHGTWGGLAVIPEEDEFEII